MTSIMLRRVATMPAWGPVIGEDGVNNTAAFVPQRLARLPLPDDSGADPVAGQQVFSSTCVACHGSSGTGVEALGAPDLTQPGGYIYGTSLAQPQQTIRLGRQGHMPAQADLLGNDKVQMLAA